MKASSHSLKLTMMVAVAAHSKNSSAMVGLNKNLKLPAQIYNCPLRNFWLAQLPLNFLYYLQISYSTEIHYLQIRYSREIHYLQISSSFNIW